MEGKKVFKLEATNDELTDIRDGLSLLVAQHELNTNHNSAERIKTLRDSLELIQRR
jgi:hypothetical protein